MKIIPFILAAILLFPGCKNNPKNEPAPESATNTATPAENTGLAPGTEMTCVTGLLQCRDTIALLIETNADTVVRQIRLSDKTGKLFSKHMDAVNPVTHVVEMSKVGLCGVITNPGKSGKTFNMNVIQIDSIVTRTPENFGLPFEFWCIGSEGGWHLEVSNFIGGNYYEHNENRTAWFLPWMHPKVSGNKWTYDFPALPGNYDAIHLVITKQKYTDPVSKRNFEYACELKINGQTLKGGVVRGKADPLGPIELRPK